MSDEPALSARDVEQLILHTCLERARSLTASVPACQEKPTFQYILDEEPIVMSATITDFSSDPFFSGYLSEEEDPSASETDDMSLSASNISSLEAASTASIHSDNLDDINEDVELYSPSEANFPELLAEDCDLVSQPCNQAQAVMVFSAGRPKMIQVAKVDLSSSSLLRRPGSSASNHTFSRSVSRMSIMGSKRHTRTNSISSCSSDKSGVPETHLPMSSPELPSTPDLDSGLRSPSSVHSPLTPRTPDSAFYDSHASPESSHQPSTPTSKPRLVRNSSYRLKLPYMNKRSTSYTNSVYSVDRLNAPLPSPPQSRSKMVARGANERSPTLELPPFPGETYFHEVKTARPLALRKDSFGSIQSRSSSIRKVRSSFFLHKS